jgi:hypothetical protein
MEQTCLDQSILGMRNDVVKDKIMKKKAAIRPPVRGMLRSRCLLLAGLAGPWYSEVWSDVTMCGVRSASRQHIQGNQQDKGIFIKRNMGTTRVRM